MLIWINTRVTCNNDVLPVSFFSCQLRGMELNCTVIQRGKYGSRIFFTPSHRFPAQNKLKGSSEVLDFDTCPRYYYPSRTSIYTCTYRKFWICTPPMIVSRLLAKNLRPVFTHPQRDLSTCCCKSLSSVLSLNLLR